MTTRTARVLPAPLRRQEPEQQDVERDQDQQLSFHRTYGSGLMIARNQSTMPRKTYGTTAIARPVRWKRPTAASPTPAR